MRLCWVITSNMATATRGTEAFPHFYRVCDLSDNQLPTQEDIVKCILHRKSEKKKILVANNLQHVIYVEMWHVTY